MGLVTGFDPTQVAPMCAVCGRQVERIAKALDALTCEMVLVVWCHGAREEMRIGGEVLERGVRIGAGVAFSKALPAAAPPLLPGL